MTPLHHIPERRPSEFGDVLRCSCARCGAHVSAVQCGRLIGGSCSVCGGGDLQPVGGPDVQVRR